MTYRTVKIQGYHSDVARACRIIYEILEEKSSIAYSIEKEPSQLDYTKAKVRSKFIFYESVLDFLVYKNKNIFRKTEEETKCSIRFREDSYNKLLKKDESIVGMMGRL